MSDARVLESLHNLGRAIEQFGAAAGKIMEKMLMSVESDLNTVLRNLDKTIAAMWDAGRDAAQEIALLVETYAKTHHLWQPETGQTDITTEALVEEFAGYIEIILTAGTPWAEFLELARQGRLAWLWPAVEHNQQEILSILTRNLRAVRI
jgi:hypothetical protein